GQDASDVFVTPANNRLYLITTNNTAGEELYIFDIANSTTPLELSSLNIGSGGHSVVVKDNYAYLATSDNSSELMIIDIQDPTSLAVNAIYNAPSSSDAYDVVVAGNYAYLATSNNPGGTPEIYILDVSDPLVPSLVGSYNVGADVYGLFYRDDLLYLATSENNAELQILDVSNKAVPSSLGGYNTPGGEEGREIVIDENEVAYLLTDNDPGSDAEFFVLDVTNPASISVLSSTDIGKGGRALFVIDEYAFVGTEAAGNQVQIFDVSDPADPQEVNSWDISALVNGIFVQEDTLYMATSDNTEELQIWSQVAGGTVGYQVQGSYESSVFGPVSNFNLIKWSEAVPSGTDLRVQIKTAPDASGSPGAWSETWCGPEGEDADETDYFTDASGGIIHPDHVGDNWIKYKLTLTSDGTITPSLEDITVNYKP
ncbi:hypothetical protein KKC60_01890, partial [Patescibacteria group bacterium]|nr:hypothetical protein [Patescibacteria group bacterium]